MLKVDSCEVASKLSKAHVHNIFCVNSFLAVDVGQHIPILGLQVL